MAKTLEVIEKDVEVLHRGDDSFLTNIKKGQIFRTKGGRYKVLSVRKEKNHRKVLVKKLK